MKNQETIKTILQIVSYIITAILSAMGGFAGASML